MPTIICSSDAKFLAASEADFRVLLYGTSRQSPDGFSIGNNCKDKIMHLDILPEQNAFDFLSIALSVIAADTFILRKDYGSDGFARKIELKVALAHSAPWKPLKSHLEKTLNFLTGDRWSLSFINGGEKAPASYEHKHLRTFTAIHKADSACLFSGGLDSLIGAINLQNKSHPVLISRSSTGDQHFQNEIAALVPNLPRFSVNDSPSSPNTSLHEISTRSRSFLFLALGGIVCSALSRLKQKPIPLIIPENGFIALNPTLTKQRIGANSTRTAHPHYLESIQTIFDLVGIPAMLQNPFALKTKGEMMLGVKNPDLLSKHAFETVSCGHWKRAGMQCGRCWPCLIRRSSFLKAELKDKTKYQTPKLKKITGDATGADLRAALFALHHFDKYKYDCDPIKSIRYLPIDPILRKKSYGMLARAFEELREFLFDQEVWS